MRYTTLGLDSAHVESTYLQPFCFQDQFGNKIPSEAANPHNVSQASMHSRVSGSHLESARNLPNSRLSSASRASTASRRGDSKRGPSDLHDSSRRSGDGGGHGSPPHETSFSRTNMMDPEAQKLRMAYERVHSLRMAPDKGEKFIVVLWSSGRHLALGSKGPGFETCLCQADVEPLGKALYMHSFTPPMCKTSNRL